jgi:hypothetical protein
MREVIIARNEYWREDERVENDNSITTLHFFSEVCASI